MGEVIPMIPRSAAEQQLDTLIEAVEGGGLIMYLMEAGSKPFMAFEFNDPVISQAGMVAAHALRDRYNQGDEAFVEAVHSYCRSVGSAYRPNDGRARA